MSAPRQIAELKLALVREGDLQRELLRAETVCALARLRAFQRRSRGARKVVPWVAIGSACLGMFLGKRRDWRNWVGLALDCMERFREQ